MKLMLTPTKNGSVINKNIYGHFSEHLGACIYNGIYVGKDSPIPNTDGIRNDIIEALKNIRVPVLRWPGGCFADEYHWHNGVGERTRMINTCWGGFVEDNSFGTHEFMELCELIGCEPYICGNVGSGTVREMSEWVEYMTFAGDSPMAAERRANGKDEPWKLKYFGVGNENWGGGGNMRVEYYSDLYRQYQTFLKNYSGNTLYKIACGPSGGDWNWTEKLMESAGKMVDGIALHYYTLPTGDWNDHGSSTDFDTEVYYDTLRETLKMEHLIEEHSRIMDKYDPEKRVGLVVDEWGTWFNPEPGTNPGFLYQQSTMRDAIVAAVNLNLFNNHCDRVSMANIAQIVNVLQAIILTEGEKMLLTPTYHVFDLFKAHQDAYLVETYIQTEEASAGVPCLSASASLKDGITTITLVNLSADKSYEIRSESPSLSRISGRILTGPIDAKNTFDEPENVKITEFNAFSTIGGVLKFTIPACSVIEIRIA
ncbi:MAG: alpha-N-arabinofuranosidase [Ruminococcus sp.]|jgi:alpha-N-arabinofuranosidase|nr:alpha-N-arabinofuranosidase [Ruminococcus sp.]